MKKVIQLCLTAFLVVGLVGCSGTKVSDEAIDKYIEVSSNTSNMKSADYAMDMNIGMGTDDVQLKTSGSYDVNNNLKMNMNIDLTIAGQTMNNAASLYVDNSILYMEVLGEKQAYSFGEYASMLESLNQNFNSEVSRDKVKEMLVSAELKADHLIFVLNKDVFEEQLKNTVAGLGATNMDVTMSNMTMDMTIENDFISNIAVDFKVKISSGGTSQDMKYHMTLGFTNINTGKEVPSPDVTAYPEPSTISEAL